MRLMLMIAVLAAPFALAGCETWNGVKKDMKKGWDATKETVRDATN